MCFDQEKMPPRDPAAGPSRSQGVNLYVKNLAIASKRKSESLAQSLNKIKKLDPSGKENLKEGCSSQQLRMRPQTTTP